MHDHEQGAQLPKLVPLPFLGYQHLADGSFQPVYAAVQPEAFQEATDYTERASDDLVDAFHFCAQCGKARSIAYHRDNPVKPGSKAHASCCTKCRSKNTKSVRSSKFLQHFCADCGKVRSRGYHHEHPVVPGKKPRPSYCLHCRTRREKEAREDGDWEDFDMDVSTPYPRSSVVGNNVDSYQEQALPPRKPSTRRFHVTVEDERAVSSGSGQGDESAELSMPAESRRRASRESFKSTYPHQAPVDEAPPTPPLTPQPLDSKHGDTEKKRDTGKKVSLETSKEEAAKEEAAVGSETRSTAPGTSSASDAVPGASQEGADCKSHVHVVYIHPPCYKHGHDDQGASSQHATEAPASRGCRADSNTTTTTSSKQSRRVAFATPEVSSRHEADADYDRTAVPENHEHPFDFGRSARASRGGYYARSFSNDGPPRRSPTPGPAASGFDSSSGRYSPEDSSTPATESSQPGMDDPSPPPEYSAPPPKLFTPDEIRRLWEQGPQPVHPRRQQREAADRRNNGHARSGEFSSVNPEHSAGNQRSVSEGDYPRGYGDGFNGFRPPSDSQGDPSLGNPGRSDHGRSGDRRAGDHRYKNDENIDPKSRHTNTRDFRPSQSHNASQQSANMPNNTADGHRTARPSRSTGTARPSEDAPSRYNNNQTNQHGSSRPNQSHGRDSHSGDNRNMYDNRTHASTGPHSSQSRASNSRSAGNPDMYGNNGDGLRPDESWYRRYEPRRNNSSEPSTSAPAQEAPFTARERMWSDNPEHARKLREAVERLERAAAAHPSRTSPPAHGARVSSDSRMPEFRAGGIPEASTRNFSSADFGSTQRNYSGSEQRDFTSSSDTRNNFTSSTRRCDFSPDVPADFVPPRPAGFSSSPPRGSTRFRAPSTFSTWEHPCGPLCNDFCPDRPDRVARQIIEVNSDEEKGILGGGGAKTGGKKGSRSRKKGGARETPRSGAESSSDRDFRLSVVRLQPRDDSVAAAAAAADDGQSPAKSVESTYYTASETSRR